MNKKSKNYFGNNKKLSKKLKNKNNYKNLYKIKMKISGVMMSISKKITTCILKMKNQQCMI